MFQFGLVPLKDVQPFGDARGRDLSLSWFGLTDGWYYIDLGSDHLLEYSPEVGWGRYVEYQVVRLYEDIMDMLPSVLAPVPQVIGEKLPDHSLAKAYAHLTAGDPEQDNDALLNALETVGHRYLDTCYLQPSANIWMWRFGETITIEWDNRDKLFDGKPVWTASKGQREQPVSLFISRVKSFHDHLMDQMRERVHAATQHWPRPEVKIDLERLRQEQLERETTFTTALATPPPPDHWDLVLKKLRARE